MAVISMKSLLETGVHFGHRTRKWNPRMKRYIFTQRNGIHIIDLQQTLQAIELVYPLIRDTVEEGGAVLFVGTKRQAQDTIQSEAERCGMPYVNMRWLGGTLTNWRTIRSRIEELETLERQREEGQFELLTKKEALMKGRRISKLHERLGGIREMRSLPSLIFVVDVMREETAVHEANLLNIPVIALVDTNCDPSSVDYVIPSNDDAIRAIKLLAAKVADAVLEGKALRKDEQEEFEPEEIRRAELEYAEISDEELLGEATLAKLESGAYDERVEAEEGPSREDLEELYETEFEPEEVDLEVEQEGAPEETVEVELPKNEVEEVGEPTAEDADQGSEADVEVEHE